MAGTRHHNARAVIRQKPQALENDRFLARRVLVLCIQLRSCVSFLHLDHRPFCNGPKTWFARSRKSHSILNEEDVCHSFEELWSMLLPISASVLLNDQSD